MILGLSRHVVGNTPRRTHLAPNGKSKANAPHFLIFINLPASKLAQNSWECLAASVETDPLASIVKMESNAAKAANFVFCHQLSCKHEQMPKKQKRDLGEVALLSYLSVIPLGLEPRAHTLKVYCSTN